MKNRLMSLIARVLGYELEAYIVFRDCLARHDYPVKTLPAGLRICRVTTVDDPELPQLCDFWARFYQTGTSIEQVRRALASYFSVKDECYCVVTDSGVVVAMAWVGFEGNALFCGFGSFIKGRRDVALRHRDFVAPDYRGHSLQLVLDHTIKGEVKAAGIRDSYIFAGVKNFASVKNLMRINDEYKLIYHLQLKLLRSKFNFYPKFDNEPWLPCAEQFSRWQ